LIDQKSIAILPFVNISIAQDTINPLEATVFMLNNKYIYVNSMPISDYDTVASISVQKGYYESSDNYYISNNTEFADHREIIQKIIKKGERWYRRGRIDEFNGVLVSNEYHKATLINVKADSISEERKAIVVKWHGVPVYLNAYPNKKYRVLETTKKIGFGKYDKFISRYITNFLRSETIKLYIDKETNQPVDYDGVILDLNYVQWKFFVFEKEGEGEDD
jgi:hypothetical protein